jgi:hypothetical protein
MLRAMDAAFDAVEQARSELAPLLAALDAQLASDGDGAMRRFFARVGEMLRLASDVEDLAGPFMELSTCAFLGFTPTLEAAALIDRALETAQRIAHTLSADGPPRH